MPHLPPNPAIARLAARMEPTLRRAFVRAVGALQRACPIDAIEAAILAGDLTPELLTGLASFPARLESIGQILARTYETGGSLASSHLGNAVNTALRFDLTNPRAATWAATRSGALITEVQRETVDAVRTLVTGAFAEGIPPADLARQIRPLVGLTERQGLAVVRYRFELLEAGRSADDVARLADRYSAQLHRYRSTLIARTETIASANAGQQEAWLQAAEQGLLDTDETRREWMAAEDERTCPICGTGGLDGTTVGLTEAFPGGYMQPPAHPACRCAVGLVL